MDSIEQNNKSLTYIIIGVILAVIIIVVVLIAIGIYVCLLSKKGLFLFKS